MLHKDSIDKFTGDMDDQSTKIHIIVILRKGAVKEAIQGRRLHELEKKRKYGNMLPRDQRGKGGCEALISILLVLWLQRITGA